MAKCCAPHCGNNKNRDYGEYTFHVFPKDSEQRAKWVEKIGRPNWIPGRRSLLCSLHFEESHFDRTGQTVRLREGAVPSIFHTVVNGKTVHRNFLVKTKSNERKFNDINHGVVYDSLLHQPEVECELVHENAMNLKEKTGNYTSEDNLTDLSLVTKLVSSSTLMVETYSEERNILPSQVEDGTWICRLCGVAGNNTTDLFSEEAAKRKLLERIHTLLSISIIKDDGFPQRVCKDCELKLDACSQLICSSLNTHRQLISMCQHDNDISSSGVDSEFQQEKIRVGPKNHALKKVLLMEMLSQEEKSMEYYIALAAEELTLRLQPKHIRHREPSCKMVIVSMCDEEKMSYGEQMGKAVEVLLSNQELSGSQQSSFSSKQARIIQHKLHSQPIVETPRMQSIIRAAPSELPHSAQHLQTTQLEQVPQPAHCEQLMNNNEEDECYEIIESPEQLDEHDLDLVPPEEMVCDVVENNIEYEQDICHKKELRLRQVVGIEYPPGLSHAQPIVDDITPLEFKNRDIKKPKLCAGWSGGGAAVTNLQKIFEWQNSELEELHLLCRVCGFVVSCNEDLQTHLEKHLDLCCRICLDLFPSKFEKDHHQCGPRVAQKSLRLAQNQSGWKSLRKGRLRTWYQCSLCSFRFKLKSNLDQHLQQHYKSQSKCKACGYMADDLNDVLTHRQSCTLLNKQTEWQCRKCMDVMDSEEALKAHITELGHQILPGWLCDVCGKRFKTGANVTQHKRTHLPREFAYIHQCSQCPKRYNSTAKLREHMEKHEGKKYMCKECGKLFGTKQILRQHESTHGEPQFSCPVCQRMFHRKSHVRNHMAIHKPGYSKKPITTFAKKDGFNRCRECNIIMEPVELVRHYQNEHPEVDLNCYTCTICQEAHTSYSALFQHQRQTHKIGGNKCMFCDKVIESSTILKYHMMKHEGMAPYNCPHKDCDKGYYSNTMLQDHMRRKHTGEKPFQCKECPKSFATNGALIQHNTVHFQPHELIPCWVCGQGFKRKAHLDIHLRTHTGEKPYPCPICSRPFRQKPDCIKHIRVMHGQDPAAYKVRFVPNSGIAAKSNVVSVAEMELVLEGEDLMQATLESTS